MSDTKNEPTTEKGLRLKATLPPERWQKIVKQARRRERILVKVDALYETGKYSYRRALKKVAPSVTWSAYRHWCRWRIEQVGPLWERMLDRRVPPKERKKKHSDLVRLAAAMLRRVDPAIDCETARQHLKKQFGDEEGNVSDRSLRRIWREQGLTYEPVGPKDKVTVFNGGTGLALLLAAETETGATARLAETVLRAGKEVAATFQVVEDTIEPAGRDERGRLTSTYNKSVRATVDEGSSDFRFFSEEEKRARRQLQHLQLLGLALHRIGARLLAMGVTPLLSERRGFNGLDGPCGAWLALLGGHPYMPNTLKKGLAELALLGVGDALQATYADQWAAKALEWSQDESNRWLQFVVYVDATYDPHWTRKYALSGKVSRVGRVMPCLSRVLITAGPGVPLYMLTQAGTTPMSKALMPALAKLEESVGEGLIGRLTVIDAEMASVQLLTALQKSGRKFVTVLKGNRSATFTPSAPPITYRERDELCEGSVVLRGRLDDKNSTMTLRAVELTRVDSRNPKPTVFLTAAEADELSTKEVADAYLSRWPHEEHVFRNLRNGGGFDHSHGFGGRYIANIALQTKYEAANHRVRARERQINNLDDEIEKLGAERKLARTKVQRERLGMHLSSLEAKRKETQKELAEAEVRASEVASQPRIIYQRDTTRENIANVLVLNALLLLEHVLKEYFGGLRMELRTFVEQFMNLPVTVRKGRHEIRYCIESNRRSPTRMAGLRAACEEITRRKIRRRGRTLVFELIEKRGQSDLAGVSS